MGNANKGSKQEQRKDLKEAQPQGKKKNVHTNMDTSEELFDVEQIRNKDER